MVVGLCLGKNTSLTLLHVLTFSGDFYIQYRRPKERRHILHVQLLQIPRLLQVLQPLKFGKGRGEGSGESDYFLTSSAKPSESKIRQKPQ